MRITHCIRTRLRERESTCVRVVSCFPWLLVFTGTHLLTTVRYCKQPGNVDIIVRVMPSIIRPRPQHHQSMDALSVQWQAAERAVDGTGSRVSILNVPTLIRRKGRHIHQWSKTRVDRLRSDRACAFTPLVVALFTVSL